MSENRKYSLQSRSCCAKRVFGKHDGAFDFSGKTERDCLTNGNEKFTGELKTLMALKFQSFEKIQFLAV